MNDKCLVGVDLKPVADVANNIIDKFAQAIGWLAEPKGTKKDMEIAVETYTKEIQKDNSLPPKVKAAKISSARKEIKEYINLQDILQHAQEFGKEYENNEDELDEDWAMFFYDKGKNVSRDDAKVLWGKILAEECKQSGSIPKILIHILSIMSRKEAKAFETLCGFIIQEINEQGVIADLLFLYSTDFGLDVKCDLTYEVLRDLEALGLICISEKLHYSNEDNSKTIKIQYHDLSVLMYAQGNNSPSIPLGSYMLTTAGLILSKLIERKKLDGFQDYLKAFYNYENIDIEVF